MKEQDFVEIAAAVRVDFDARIDELDQTIDTLNKERQLVLSEKEIVLSALSRVKTHLSYGVEGTPIERPVFTDQNGGVRERTRAVLPQMPPAWTTNQLMTTVNADGGSPVTNLNLRPFMTFLKKKGEITVIRKPAGREPGLYRYTPAAVSQAPSHEAAVKKDQGHGAAGGTFETDITQKESVE
jgi:hypothetical protein